MTRHQHQALSFHYLFLFLCSVLPVTSFLSYNRLEIQMEFSRGIFYVLAIFGVLTILFEGTRRLFKSLQPQALAISLGVLCVFLFHFSVIYNGLISVIGEGFRFRHFVIGVPFFILALSLASYHLAKRYFESLKQFLLSAAIVFIAMDAYQIVITPSTGTSTQKTPLSHTAQGPNVYYILPDAMMGPEAYQKTFSQKDVFVEYLQNKGFYVNQNAYTNAPFTIYSLAHLFNMDYLLDEQEIVTPNKSHDLTKLAKGENQVYRQFHEKGYKIVHVVDGYVVTCSGYEDECVEKKSLFKKQDVSFIDRTQIISLLNNLQFLTQSFNLIKLHYPKAMELEELVEHLPIKANDGYFMMIHLGLPHMPYRYQADCSRYNGDVAYFSGDKLHVYDLQHQCAQKKLPLLVDKIIEQDPDAIVIVQSDHGPLVQAQGFKPNHELTPDDLMQNFNIISAYKLPQSCQAYLPETSLSPINTFRLVFGCLESKQPEYLPHKSYVVYPLNNPAGHEPTLSFDPPTTYEKG